MARASVASSRVQAVTGELRMRIFEGRYPPGSALRELTLAHELSVSQATIREALQRLQHAGLVTRVANVGSTVTRLSPKNIRERVELRAMLEVKAAQEACPRMGESEYAELQRRLEALESAVASDSYYDAAQADLGFHRYIWECSGNDTLREHLELVATPLFAFISILRSQGVQQLTAVVESHEPLIAALRSGKPDRIREAFGRGAVSAYLPFVDEGAGQGALSALGLMEA